MSRVFEQAISELGGKRRALQPNTHPGGNGAPNQPNNPNNNNNNNHHPNNNAGFGPGGNPQQQQNQQMQQQQMQQMQQQNQQQNQQGNMPPGPFSGNGQVQQQGAPQSGGGGVVVPDGPLHPHNPMIDMTNMENLIKNVTRPTDEPSTAASKNVDVTVGGVLTAVKFNIALFVVFVLLFEVLRRILPSVYESKRYGSRRRDGAAGSPYGPDTDGDTTSMEESQRSLGASPSSDSDVSKYAAVEAFPETFLPLNWVPSVYRVPWSRVLEVGGLDAYMFLRFIRMCFRIAAISGFWSMCLLFPIYATGSGNDVADATGWYRLSMAHVARGSWRLWFPALFCWLMTLYVGYVMNEEYKHFIEKRMHFLMNHTDARLCPQHSFSVMVEGIPTELRSEDNLYQFFNRLFPGKVHSTSIVLDAPDLRQASHNRFMIKKRLEKAIAYKEATSRRPVHTHGRSFKQCCGIENMTSYGSSASWKGDSSIDLDREPQNGEQVDSINYYQRELKRADIVVENKQIQKRSMAASSVPTGTVRATSSFVSPSRRSVADGGTEDGMILNVDDKSKSRDGILALVGKFGFDFLFSSMQFFYRNLTSIMDKSSDSIVTSTGFVTFMDLKTATCAASIPLIDQDLSDNFLVSSAPEPRDIQLENAHLDILWTSGREWTANVLLTFGIILWSVPVSLIQALSSVDSLAQIPGLTWMANIGGDHAAFINGYLPVVALLGLIMLLPIFFRWVAVSYESRKTKSGIETSIFSRFFYYQLANVYITVSAGSILDALYMILDHPGNALGILAASFPTVVGYFVSLLLTKTLAGLPIVMLRFGQLGRFFFYKLFFRESKMTQREIDAMYKPVMLQYGWEYPTQLLVVLICFTYACIAPIILPVGAAFFLFALVVYKMQVLYVYVPEFESGGAMFPSVCNRTLIGLICGQLTLMGYMVTMLGFIQFLILCPLPIFTYKIMRSFKRTYAHSSSKLSMQSAMDLDDANAGKLQASFDKTYYMQPALKVKSTGPMPYRRRMDVRPNDGGIKPGSFGGLFGKRQSVNLDGTKMV